ncbi:hypothetical protein AGMMS49545_00620 [Betaproteobacteria bacterium]|nr:hypothetical protein AGMMS49545_00620 [Betaproteobacteria bacterium]GHU40680.1 hypothetical protein AGMMS50289_02610 [Betaproteobacteria bacterium]
MAISLVAKIAASLRSSLLTQGFGVCHPSVEAKQPLMTVTCHLLSGVGHVKSCPTYRVRSSSKHARRPAFDS